MTSATPVSVPPVPTPEISDIDLPVGVVPNFLGGRLAMHLRVGGILELLWHPGVWRRGDQLLRFGDGGGHAAGRWRQHHLGAEPLEDHAALDADRLRHNQDAVVALRGGDPRQPNAGVAAGRLDDRPAGFEDATLFGVADHADGDAVLDAVARLE